MRLDRFLAHETGRTRKEADRLVRRGLVTVDGVVTTRPADHVDPTRQVVAVDGAPVEYLPQVTLMLNKPAEVVSATEDPGERTVLDLIDPRWVRPGLAPVGRLDKDTTGLLLLTTDGQLSHALTHPRRHVARVYEAQLEGALDANAAERFARGVALADGTICKPARLEAIGPDRVRVTLTEGRYHQVKRMIAACGAHVAALRRLSMGPLTLDPALPEGEARPLTADELGALRDAVREAGDR